MFSLVFAVLPKKLYLIIMKAESALMKEFVVPMDILNLTPQEYRERKSIGFFERRVVG